MQLRGSTSELGSGPSTPGPDRGAPTRTARAGFVGRARELRALSELLASEGRLVTIVGPPGSGKTRLALEQGLEEGEDGREPTVVDLSFATSTEDVLGRLSEALSVPLTDGEGLEDATRKLSRALGRRRPSLLVLDNCEHLRAELAAALPGLRSAAPGLRVLVTSRERLGVEDEHLVELGPLSFPAETEVDPEEVARHDAVELFVRRARQRVCDFRLEDAGAATVSAIVRVLDGNPLAIELAAARVPMLGATELLVELDRRFDVLEAPSAGASARFGSLERAIEWSWDLLDDEERRALARLSVFRGGFTLEAAERTLAVEGDGEARPKVVDLLQALMDRSLLRAEACPTSPGARRLSLDASVRAYAARKLESSGEADLVEAARAGYYVAALGPSPDGEHIFADESLRRRLRAERANLLAASEWASAATPARPGLALRALLALAPVYCTEGPFAEYLRLVEDAQRLAEETGELDAVLSAASLIARATIESRRGRFSRACEHLERALPLVRGARATSAEAYVLIVLGGMLPFAYREAEVPRLFERARRLVAKLDDDRLAAILAKEVASTMMWRAPDLAESYLERALLLFRLGGDRAREAYTLSHLCTCRFASGKLDEAERCGERAVAALEARGDERWAAHTRTVMALIDLERGRPENAEAAIVRALAVQRRLGNQWLEAFCLLGLAELRLGEGRAEEARAGLLEVLEIARPMDERTVLAWATASLGRAAAALDDLDEAASCIDEALGLARLLGDEALVEGIELRRGFVDLARCRAAVAAGDGARARAWLEAARARTARHEDAGERLRGALRFPLRSLQRALAEATRVLEQGLVVGRRGSWFSVRMGEPVCLRRRPRLRQVLSRLVEERVGRPGHGLALHELFEAGWPGDRATPDSAANRVYVSLTRLRNLGLADLLTCDGDGFLLDPSAPIVLGGRQAAGQPQEMSSQAPTESYVLPS